ncbi:MAG: DUF3137 domain-containing protein [Saprospiraceae bacterium]|nr:DUF3137 domain-containing protein [Saprospiraceae bacterium]MCB9344947.1 DUF3137 domain-containing protein [Lewinellaceae bacterium]
MLSAYQDFRLFYNQTIHPELLHLEQRRLRLIRLLGVSILLLLFVLALQIYLSIFFVSLLLSLLVGFWIAYIGFRIQVFFREFKPRIVALLLDFIDNDVNYSFEGYEPKGKIPAEKFFESRLFVSGDEYKGEDLIRGKVRETPYELCELRVKEFSPVRTKLDVVFNGIFMIGDYQRWDMQGAVLVLPDSYRKYSSRSEKAFHLIGGRRVKDNLLPEFEAFFDTYATPDVRIKDIISPELQQKILKIRSRFQEVNRQKEIYFSIIGDKIYLALTQDKDLLEPSLLRSNVSYAVVREFYDDLSLLLDAVLAVDAMN